MAGYKSEVLVSGEWEGNNGIVWPDMASAEAAGADLYRRWTMTADYRGVAVDEAANRPTWSEWVAQRGLPPHSVSLVDHTMPDDAR